MRSAADNDGKGKDEDEDEDKDEDEDEDKDEDENEDEDEDEDEDEGEGEGEEGDRGEQVGKVAAKTSMLACATTRSMPRTASPPSSKDSRSAAAASRPLARDR